LDELKRQARRALAETRADEPTLILRWREVQRHLATGLVVLGVMGLMAA
jgi:hypothetical protein